MAFKTARMIKHARRWVVGLGATPGNPGLTKTGLLVAALSRSKRGPRNQPEAAAGAIIGCNYKCSFVTTQPPETLRDNPRQSKTMQDNANAIKPKELSKNYFYKFDELV